MDEQKPKIANIRKRDGRVVPFDRQKISEAIFKAAQAVGGRDRYLAEDLSEAVTLYLEKEFSGRVPSVEEVQDIVERVLIKTGHAKTAKAYIVYREKRARLRQARGGLASNGAPASGGLWEKPGVRDMGPDVRTSNERMELWNRERIIEALVRESGVSRNIGEIIVLEVEEEIIYARVPNLSTALIRELVNAKLVQYGFDRERDRHARLGVPLHDVRELLADPAGAPDETTAILGEHIKKEFALSEVFSTEVADAHFRGIFHIHHLAGIDRLHSLEFAPAFLDEWMDCLRGGQRQRTADFFAAVPEAAGLLRRYFNEPALIRNTGSLGAAEPPDSFLRSGNTPGFQVDLTPADAGAIAFCRAYLTARAGFPLLVNLPRPAEATAPLWELAAALAVAQPAVTLVNPPAPPRDEISLFGAEGSGEIGRTAAAPEYALQDITLDLPRIALQSKQEKAAFFDTLDKTLVLAGRAHREKMEFMSRVCSRWPCFLPRSGHPKPLLQLADAACRISLTGLSETVCFQTGSHPSDSRDSFGLLLDILTHLTTLLGRVTAETGLKFQLAQNNDRRASLRLSGLDQEYFFEAWETAVRKCGECFSYRDFPAFFTVAATPEEMQGWQPAAALLRNVRIPVFLTGSDAPGSAAAFLERFSASGLRAGVFFQGR